MHMRVDEGGREQRSLARDGPARRGRVGGVPEPGDPAVDDVQGAARPVADRHTGDEQIHSVTRGSKRARTPGLRRYTSSARAACPAVSPCPTSIVTSAGIPSAPSAPTEKDVDMEKKTTVPPSAVT